MTVALDAEGYLVDLADWSEAVAVDLAKGEGIELGAEHWQVVHAVRDFYAQTGVSPANRPLIKLVRERVGPELGSSIALMKLFRGVPAKRVAKVAGLPKPTNCL